MTGGSNQARTPDQMEKKPRANFPEELMDPAAAAPDHGGFMAAGESNILVAVRCRPLSTREIACHHKEVVKVMDGKIVIVTDPPADEKDVLRVNRSREKRYAFDHAFPQESTQDQIFNATTKLLIDGFLEGFNSTVFAYGATGTGKTHTMIGSAEQPGNMVMTMQSIFEKVARASDKIYKVKMSYLEIYNEMIHDLLRGGGGNPEAAKLDLREDPSGQVNVAGLSAVEADSTDRVMELLATGNKYRTMEPTQANAVSSRSHAVLQITCECRDRTANTNVVVKVGKLSLIDLAGSERASMTHNVGARMLEGANINRSLLALGNCINALAGNSSRKGYIPYRDSKLTRLLKDSLGGNCRTVMIVTASPSHLYQEETLNTLKYANRAKNIKTTQTRNTTDVNYHVAQYLAIIAELRNEVSELKATRDTAPPAALSSPVLQPIASAEKKLSKDSEDDKRERVEMEKLKSAIHGNYQERVEVRRQLLELNDLNLNNKIQISKRQLEVHRWEKENTGTDNPVPSWVAAARNDVKTAKSNVSKNLRLQKELEVREADLVEESGQLRETTRKQIRLEERRSLLEKQFEMCDLELEKMQLQQGLKSHTSQLVDRDLRIRKLSQRLDSCNDVIKQQRNLLDEHGIETAGLEEQGANILDEADERDASSSYRRDRVGDATPRNGGMLPRIGSRQAGGNQHSGGRQGGARSRQRSREGLLGQLGRLNSARASAHSRDPGSGSRAGSRAGPPVLVTVSPRRGRGESGSIGHPSPGGRGGGGGHGPGSTDSGDNRHGGGYGQNARSEPARTNPYSGRRGNNVARRAPSDAPSVRSNELDYNTMQHNTPYGGRRNGGNNANRSPQRNATGGRSGRGSAQRAGRLGNHDDYGGGGGGGGNRGPVRGRRSANSNYTDGSHGGQGGGRRGGGPSRYQRGEQGGWNDR